MSFLLIQSVVLAAASSEGAGGAQEGGLVFPRPLAYLFVVLFGAIIGSFLNAVIHRLPRDISLLRRRRSFCPKCEAGIAWYDNIPIFSYILLRGRCRRCREGIPPRYLAVELLTAGLFALVYRYAVELNAADLGWPAAAVLAVFLSCLVGLTFIDIEEYIIPNEMTYLSLAVGIIAAPLVPYLHFAAQPWTGNVRLDALIDAVEGAVLGGGAIWGVGALGVLLFRKEAMGGGDVKLLAAVGAVLGWKLALVTLVLGACLGSVGGVAAILWARMTAARGKARVKRGAGTKSTPGLIAYETDDVEERKREDERYYKSFRLAMIGLAVLLFEGGMMAFLATRTDVPRSCYAAPLAGLVLGTLMVLFDLVRRHLFLGGRWIEREYAQDEGGKDYEVYRGRYVPFGPYLALAAVLAAIWGPLLVWLVKIHVLGLPAGLRLAVPFVG